MTGALGCTAEPAPNATFSPVKSSPTVQPSATPVLVRPPMGPLSAAQVVSGLKQAGFACGKDGGYTVCRSTPVEVWVLAGAHKRVPVVSLHARGPVPAAHAAIGKQLPPVLKIAHVNEVLLIDDWYRRQAGQGTASRTFGDWRVELSAESGTDEPGVHLTLNDRLCKTGCQAE